MNKRKQGGQFPMEEEALDRKQRSLEILKSAGIRCNEFLPVVETENESLRRTSEEIAERAMALCAVALKGEGLEQEAVDELIARWRLGNAFTAEEFKFVRNSTPSEHDRAQFAWRYECFWVMLWALGYIESLDVPRGVCDVPKAVGILHHLGHDAFLMQARLRPQSELLDAADLIYRYHWAVVDARVNGGETPQGIDGGVVMERHYALNWLVGSGGQEWDDISTST